MLTKIKYFCFLLLLFPFIIKAQVFYRGADLSYVNEMEDCGVVFKEDNSPTDVFTIFKNHGCNMVRFRLWNSPSWYDGLNSGKRYSDFNDVIKSVKRAKDAHMSVLLDFHFSDSWADPSKQLVPNAWLSVVNDINALQDSLHNYVYTILSNLDDKGLLPEMVQIGNETNKGILLSPDDNSIWTLDWARNSKLFNTAIDAVRQVQSERSKHIDIALHIADPKQVSWLLADFISHGVTDFDVIGMSYYWAYHKPTSIVETGSIIKNLKSKYPEKKIFIFETAYIWTTQSNDQANNIISEVNPEYSPASPNNQYRWMNDLTNEIKRNGGSGVLYWEPAWVSSSCYTQWGRGSHQENAAFFDFQSNLLSNGAIKWMDDGVISSTSHDQISTSAKFQFLNNELILLFPSHIDSVNARIVNSSGSLLASKTFLDFDELRWNIGDIPFGIYFLTLNQTNSTSSSFMFIKK